MENKRRKLNEAGMRAPVVTESIESTSEAALSHEPKASKAVTKHGNDEPQNTLFIRSLPADTTSEQLAEFFSQNYPIKHAVAVIDRDTNQCKGYGFATFTDAEDAQRAKEELNGAELGGKKISISYAEKRQRENEAAGTAKPARKQSGRDESAPQLSSKLIVRNLPWSINSPEKLAKLFLSFGKINDTVVPKDARGLMRGFGIVLLRGRRNAELALQKMNGKEVDGRILAVDWAVQKETWQSAQTKAPAEHEDEQASNSKDNNYELEHLESEDGEADGSESDEEAEQLEEEDVADEEADTPDDPDSVPTVFTQTTNTTLFVRNLPFTVADDDIKEHFEVFGSIRYARVVLDPATQRSRGTAFVCFRTKADADNCLANAPRQTITKGSDGKRVNTGPTILEDELLDPLGNYTIDGRVLQVSRAVDRSEASRLTAQGVASRSRRDNDKRRLYLLNEGTIGPNSALYGKFSSAELALREASLAQRKKLVDNDPALNLSLTRLSVRNIPRSITSKDLKMLAREAVVSFAKDVKEGKRQPLSKEELARFAEEMRQAEAQRKARGKGLVKQAKVVFEGSDGAKVQEGSGRSRGYGFVEYHTHRTALMGLRWLNGRNVGVQAEEKKGSKAKVKQGAEEALDGKRRLVVEFAIENAQVVQRRAELEARSRNKPAVPDSKRPEETSMQTFKTTAKGSGSRKDGKFGKKLPPGKTTKAMDDSETLSRQRKMIAKKKNARRARQN